MLLVANLANTKMMQKSWKMTETLANGYSSESTQQELSNEYQQYKVQMVFKDFCIFLPWTKVASALKGLTHSIWKSPLEIPIRIYDTSDDNFGTKKKRFYQVFIKRIVVSNIQNNIFPSNIFPIWLGLVCLLAK